jgi:hypothetical protein
MLDYNVRFPARAENVPDRAYRGLPFRACALMLREASVMNAIINSKGRRQYVE